jgi:FKBP-type peptidyl-prolyl cis-trans isomerase FklB
MKSQLVVILSILFLAANVFADEKLELKDNRDKISYSIGINIGTNMKNQSIDVNPEALVRGLRDALSGDKALMTEEEINEALTGLQKEMASRQAQRIKEVAEKNKKKGDAFLKITRKKKA